MHPGTMTAETTKRAIHSSSSARSPQEDRLALAFYQQLDPLLRYKGYFKLGFAVLLLVELLLLIFGFSFLYRSAWLGLVLAIVFLTAAGYFVSDLYLQTRQQDHLELLIERVKQTCRKLYPGGSLLEHATVYLELAHKLKDREKQLYKIPRILDFARKPLSETAVRFHKGDTYKIRWLLIHAAIEDQIRSIKNQPTDSASHAALGGSYKALALLCTNDELAKLSKKGIGKIAGEDLSKGFLTRSAEEYRIAKELAPDDLGARYHLASVYEQLGAFGDAIKEMEQLVDHTASISVETMDDRDELLFQLGRLYFVEGRHGAALQIYQQLNLSRSPLAPELLRLYGHYGTNEPSS